MLAAYTDHPLVVRLANLATADTLPPPNDSSTLSESSTSHFPATRSNLYPNYNHTWHPDSYGTLLFFGTLSIAVNRLSLEKNWCGPNRLPPWALKDVDGLLLASDHVQASPTKFSAQYCFPPDTKLICINDFKPKQTSKLVRQSNDGNSILVSPLTKKARVSFNPKRGRPFHLSNLNYCGSKTRGDGRLGGGSPRLRAVHRGENLDFDNLCEVTISPSKEMEEAEERGLLGRNRRASSISSAVVDRVQLHRQP